MQGILVCNHFLKSEKFETLHRHYAACAAKRGHDLQVCTNLELACMPDSAIRTDYVLFLDKDVVLARRLEKLGLPVYEISTASHEGLKELKFALARQVSKTREIVRKLEAEHEQERVVIKPLEMARNRAKNQVGPAFNVIRHGDPEGNYWFVVKGEKIARMVIQTDFNNNEAVGYLADRLASLGVEDALKAAGAVEGDEVHMGPAGNEVVFNWEPTITAGAEGLDDAPLVSRGDDIRLRDYGYAKRRSNSQRRVDYHEEMDRRAEARAERERERRAGHWSDPSVTDSSEQPNE